MIWLCVIKLLYDLKRAEITLPVFLSVELMEVLTQMYAEFFLTCKKALRTEQTLRRVVTYK